MNILEFKENKDGSAIITMDMTGEEKSYCIEAGFISMLKNYIEKTRKELNNV
jgi:hypothetical protein